MLSTPVVLQPNQVKRTPHDHTTELNIGILNSLVVSKINIEYYRFLGTTSRFNIPIIDSLLHS